MTKRKEKFTPGPWKSDKYFPAEWEFVSPGQYGYRIQYGKYGEEICERVYEGADAALIAAAPEMYALLKQLHGVLEKVPLLQDEIEKVLKKARGEE